MTPISDTSDISDISDTSADVTERVMAEQERDRVRHRISLQHKLSNQRAAAALPDDVMNAAIDVLLETTQRRVAGSPR
jgi:hypothetical protein